MCGRLRNIHFGLVIIFHLDKFIEVGRVSQPVEHEAKTTAVSLGVQSLISSTMIQSN